MHLTEIQVEIATYRNTATLDELEALQEMMATEDEAINEQLIAIEAERQEALERAEQLAWESLPEGKEEAHHFHNAISLWYRSEDKLVTVNGDRRHPNQWKVFIEARFGYTNSEFVGSQAQVIRHVESIVGPGTPYSPNPNKGARSWRYRWFSYHDNVWLVELLAKAA